MMDLNSQPFENECQQIKTPYKFPTSSLINSIDSPSNLSQSPDKSAIEEETTCQTKYALKTLSNENITEGKTISPKTVNDDNESSTFFEGNFKLFKCLVEMKNQLHVLQKGLIKTRQSLQVLENENVSLTEKKEKLHQRLREKFEKIRRSKKSFNCCFF
jgi:hypothetical protein